MKTLKLSLNALAALCCLVLFITSCQDDTLENELQPSSSANDISTDEARQLLQTVIDHASSNPTAINARTAAAEEAFVYNLTLTSFEFAPSADNQRGERIEQQNGTLTLVEADSIPGLNVIAEGDTELYTGTYRFTESTGDTVTQQAAAIIVGEFSALLIATPGGDLFISNFVLGGNFATPEGATGVLARDEQGERIVVVVDAGFVESDVPETPTMPEDTFSYRLQLELFDSDPEAEQPDLGIRNLVDRIPGTLILSPAAAPLEGDLDVDPSVSFEGDPIFTGIFEFTDEDGNLQTRPVSAAVDLETGIGYLDVNNVLGTEDVGEVVIATPTFRPDLMFEGISFTGLTTATTTGNPDLPEVVVVKVNGQLIGEPSLPQPDIAASYTYDLMVAVDLPDGQGSLVELTTPGRLDVTLFVDGDVGARYFFTSDGINSSASFQGGLTDEGTITLTTTSSTLGDPLNLELPAPGLGKLVITDLPTLDNREATPSAIAFDRAGQPLGDVTVDATITEVIIDEEEVDL